MNTRLRASPTGKAEALGSAPVLLWPHARCSMLSTTLRVTFIASTLLLASSCGHNITYVLRTRDSSSRPKPNNLIGRIVAFKADAGSETALVFAGTQVGAEWTEEATTATTDEPTGDTAYEIVGWLELDGQGAIAESLTIHASQQRVKRWFAGRFLRRPPLCSHWISSEVFLRTYRLRGL